MTLAEFWEESVLKLNSNKILHCLKLYYEINNRISRRNDTLTEFFIRNFQLLSTPVEVHLQQGWHNFDFHPSHKVCDQIASNDFHPITIYLNEMNPSF